MFRRLTALGVIKNLGLIDVEINGVSQIGALVGYSLGTIENCYATGTVAADNFAGGLVGYFQAGTISHCHATGAVADGQLRLADGS
ncbi:MAG: hypothetical protein H0U74_16470 [Bradymonadaceae bacterium]|nr:hypothetical protein [Lujinxingiaceae bacterium]